MANAIEKQIDRDKKIEKILNQLDHLEYLLKEIATKLERVKK